MPKVRFPEPVGEIDLIVGARTRHLRISIRPFQSVRVNAPAGLDMTVIENFVLQRSSWIVRHREGSRQRERNTLQIIGATGKQRKENIDRQLTTRFEKCAETLGVSYERLVFRNQSTRWASCSSKGNINLNRALSLLPKDLQEYVMVHEMVHLKTPNQGVKFWNRLEEWFPGAAAADRRLKDYAIPPPNLFLE